MESAKLVKGKIYEESGRLIVTKSQDKKSSIPQRLRLSMPYAVSTVQIAWKQTLKYELFRCCGERLYSSSGPRPLPLKSWPMANSRGSSEANPS